MARKNPEDFGDNATPGEPELDVESKEYRVILKDGSVMEVKAFRLFTSFDANLGLVVRALRSDEQDVGVFYAPLGWVLKDPSKWKTEP